MSPNLLTTFQPDSLSIQAGTSEPSLNEQIVTAQEDHFPSLLALQCTHHLTIDQQNHFHKDLALVVVENDDLKRGVLHTFHTLHMAGHPGISNTLALIRPYY